MAIRTLTYPGFRCYSWFELTASTEVIVTNSDVEALSFETYEFRRWVITCTIPQTFADLRLS